MWKIMIGAILALSLFYIGTVFQTALYINKSSSSVNDDGSVTYICSTDETWSYASKIKELFYESCEPLRLNEIGDFLAGSLSFVALLWFALGFIWQAREFSLQRQEYSRNVDILSKQLEQANTRDIREAAFQKGQNLSDEVQVCREKIDQVVSIVQFIHDRYPELNERTPKSLAAVVSVIESCIDKLDGGYDPSDEILTRTRIDLDEINTQLNYLVSSIDENDLRKRIPISDHQMSIFKDLLVKLDRTNFQIKLA